MNAGPVTMHAETRFGATAGPLENVITNTEQYLAERHGRNRCHYVVAKSTTNDSTYAHPH